ncbi:sigma-70 family RNA polymerase sigma factor [Amycolatopsis sp. PS_44_ISF1]|uniref:sigma-70 family RNA polymerase sigma factor n=1 Tax=Amycolatopsis sp. PS_44_ISF1 TaxID=2974917 RepID=UPI0028E06DC1|nr:sigma-70 family RNA polymerase sigma factor [Amycolatopsis sp. PS_44_ISF1]MDT8911658.1 sigma-70 family RNA polymerase sigma factor [Amycolatopsis sp. PS_44_ISF1]
MPTLDDIVRVHGPALRSYATGLTGDRYLAEDVVQETWLRAWRHLDRLAEDRGPVRAWLIRVAHNVAVDLHRRRRARPLEIEFPASGLEAVATVSSPVEEVEERIVVGAALGSLSASHSDTLMAVYFADRTAGSAAAALGIPVGTVKSRLHHALRTLRAPGSPLQPA